MTDACNGGAQQNDASRLKGCCTKMLLGEGYLLAVARKTFAVMVIAVAVTSNVIIISLRGFYVRIQSNTVFVCAIVADVPYTVYTRK